MALAVDVEVQRLVADGDLHPADRVDGDGRRLHARRGRTRRSGVAPGHDLGQDGDGDLARRAGADVQAGGAVELGAELVGDVELPSGPGTVPDGASHPAGVGGTGRGESAPDARREPSGGPDVVGHPGSAGDGPAAPEKGRPGRGADDAASAARHEVVDLLDRLGFAPRADDDAASVALTRCPLLEAAYRNPEVVCAVHLGLAQGALERLGAPREGTSLLPFAEPGACRLYLRPADGSPEGIPDRPTPEPEATTAPGHADSSHR